MFVGKTRGNLDDDLIKFKKNTKKNTNITSWYNLYKLLQNNVKSQNNLDETFGYWNSNFDVE